MTKRRERTREDFWAGLEEGLQSDYVVRPPNKPIRLYRGAFEIRQGGRFKVRGSIDQHWHPHPGVRFSGRITGSDPPELGTATLVAQTVHVNWPVEITSLNLGHRPRVSGYVPAPARLGRKHRVWEVKFCLPNFHAYHGRAVKFTLGPRRWISASRIRVAVHDWIITVDQHPQFEDLRKLLAARGGYGVGHVGTIRRADGSRFDFAEAAELHGALHFFFSFCRGLWCGPIITSGMGRKRALWTVWGSWRITDWVGVSSWFPRDEPTNLGPAFSGFWTLWNRKEWNPFLRELVHWYVEANLHAGALAGSLVLGHAALEVMAWMHVVVDHKLIKEDRFDGIRGGSAERIRTVCRALSIPTFLPTELTELTAFAKRQGIADGPEAIVRHRNWLVHPSPRNRRIADKASVLARFETLQLCLWYLEMGLLAECGYRGKYVSRLMRNVTVAQATRDVPWK